MRSGRRADDPGLGYRLGPAHASAPARRSVGAARRSARRWHRVQWPGRRIVLIDAAIIGENHLVDLIRALAGPPCATSLATAPDPARTEDRNHLHRPDWDQSSLTARCQPPLWAELCQLAVRHPLELCRPMRHPGRCGHQRPGPHGRGWRPWPPRLPQGLIPTHLPGTPDPARALAVRFDSTRPVAGFEVERLVTLDTVGPAPCPWPCVPGAAAVCRCAIPSSAAPRRNWVAKGARRLVGGLDHRAR